MTNKKTLLDYFEEFTPVKKKTVATAIEWAKGDEDDNEFLDLLITYLTSLYDNNPEPKAA